MGQFEYKVLPAPRRAVRVKGVKGEPARFAQAISDVMNELAADGWEYVKSEALPMEAKSGMFKGREETFVSLLVFRRALGQDEGEVLSVTPAVVAAGALTSEAEMPGLEEPKVEPSIVEEVKDTLSFDEENVDPLKTLVDDHRRSIE